ncbi:MAG: MarR family transcriptional regulator [Chloroflexi bacterium]|nr:MarR family transcriptional regulator [Chloroflexota bacterium]
MRAEDSLGGLLGKSSRLMRNQLHHNLRQVESQITVEQWILLAELWSEDGLAPLELSKRLLKHKASITSLLKRAGKSGYVYRQQDSQDRRAKKVFLTDKGRQLEASLIPVAIQTIMSATDGINPDHLAITTSVLKQLISNLTVNQI